MSKTTLERKPAHKASCRTGSAMIAALSASYHQGVEVDWWLLAWNALEPTRSGHDGIRGTHAGDWLDLEAAPCIGPMGPGSSFRAAPKHLMVWSSWPPI